VVITLIKEYQTLIVGGLGFVGVIATLLTNARLTRRQYARQIERESSNVKAALRSELGIIRAAFQDRIEMLVDPAPNQSALIPLDTMTDVYSSLIDRVGLLSEHQIDVVMRPYLAS